MKQIVVKVPDSQYEFFEQLMAKLGFAKSDADNEQTVYESVTQGLTEVSLIKSGKLAKKPARELLREI